MESRLRELLTAFKPKLIEATQQLCAEMSARVSRGIATGEVEIGATVHRIENTTGQLKQGEWEVRARAQQLASARQQKQLVEERLRFLSESLADLSAPSQFSPQQRSAHTDKLRESALFARKMQEEQRALQRIRATGIARQVASLQEREALDHSRRVTIERKEAEEREARLNTLQMQAQARAERLSQLKSIIPVRKSSPSMPTSNSPKSDLAKKHETKESLIEHLHRYKSRLKTEQQRRLRLLEERKLTESVHSALFSNSYMAILQEGRDRKQEQVRATSEKVIAAAKQRRYAELVREMYFPVIDRRKVEEMQALKAASTHKRTSNGLEKRKIEESTDSERQSRPSLPRRRKLPKVEVQPAVPKPVDYLAEQRRSVTKRTIHALQILQRTPIDWEADLHDSSLSATEKVQRVQRKAAVLEDRARREEALLGRAEVSVQGLEAQAGLNDMLVASVQAKLALLQV